MKIKSIISVLLVLFLTSCGSGIPEEKILKVSNVSISGNAKNFIKVVNGEYKIKNVNDNKIIIPLKIKLIKKVKINNPKMSSISLSMIDNSGVSVGNSYGFKLQSLSDYSKIEDLLKGEVGNTVIISFESILASEDTRKQIMEQAVNVEITNTNISIDEDASTITSTNNSNGNDWDNILDEYENYVNDYISLYKKAMNGDTSALSEYTNMLKNAEKLQKSLEKAKKGNTLSKTQMNRMLKIQNKMLNAVR